MFRTPDPELLSAYLDGELSPQERLRVEEWLARDPAAKQLLEELRREQTLIRALPRSAVPRDLSQSVLEIAEQRIILEGAGPTMAGAEAGGSGRGPRLTAFLRRLMRPRNLGWAILAGSIGLAIMLLYPERRHQEVGLVRPVPEEPATLEAKRLVQKEVPSISPQEVGGLRGSASFPMAATSGDEGRGDGAPSATQAEAAASGAAGRGLLGTSAGPEPAPPMVASPPGTSSDRQANAPAVMIESVRPLAPPGAPSTGRGSRQRAPEAEEVLEIRGEVAPGTPLEPLVQRILARRQAVPEDAREASPWEFAGHVEKSRPEGFGEQLNAPPPGVRLEFTRDEREERVMVEFSATRPQLQAILAELEADPKRVTSITLPTRLEVLGRGRAAEIAAQSRRAAAAARKGELGGAGMGPSPGQVESGPSAPAAAAAEIATTDRHEVRPSIEEAPAVRRALPDAAPAGAAKETAPPKATPGQPERYRIRLILAKPVGDQPSPSSEGRDLEKQPGNSADPSSPQQSPPSESPSSEGSPAAPSSSPDP